MKCGHDDCFTCPFEDCISSVEVEPERSKRGRKRIPDEEKKKRRKITNHAYYVAHPEKWAALHEKRKKMNEMFRA